MIFNDNCCSKIANNAPAGKNGRLRDRGGAGRREIGEGGEGRRGGHG